MKVSLYARVSTLDKGQDPEVQLRELREYVAHRGWEVVGEFVDRVSGAKEQRPDLDRLLLEMRRGKCQGFVVVRLDRLGRSLKHLLTLLTDFEERNIALISLKEGIDFSTSTGKLMFSIVGAMAQFERDLIRERVKAGLDYARAKGVRIGRKPISVDHEEIYRLKAQGCSMRQIAKAVGVSAAYVCRVLKGAHGPTT